jgi:hypothetical protein
MITLHNSTSPFFASSAMMLFLACAIAWPQTFDGDVSFGFFDMNSNNIVDPNDAIFKFSIGFSRGFL